MHMCEEISSTESIRASKQKFTENPHLLIQLFTKFLLNKIHQLPPMSLMMMMMIKKNTLQHIAKANVFPYALLMKLRT